jgi:DNA modification methylase
MEFVFKNGVFILGNCLAELKKIEAGSANLIIADPPYFKVLVNQEWDNRWKSELDYINWTIEWVKACKRVLAPRGLMYIFGQLGKREHVWLHVCSEITKILQFHDMIIWDRVVGYNDRSDSFTPQYENILCVRHKDDGDVYFNKDAVRIPYENETIEKYMRDKRYKDAAKRREHLNKGKYATNILRVPSLKGSSKEKVGHPSQKPLELIKMLVESSSKAGDTVLDPFLGSGTTASACEMLNRKWIGIEQNCEYRSMIENRIMETAVQEELLL